MKTFLLCMLLLPYQALFAAVKFVNQQGFVITNQLEIETTPETVWSALIHDVDLWWPKDHSWWQGRFSIQAQAGGCFCENIADKSAEHMRISFVEPNKLLRMTGGLGPLQGMGIYGALDWQLDSQSNGANQVSTRVTLRYQVVGLSQTDFRELSAIVDSVQATQLNSLREYLSQAKQQ